MWEIWPALALGLTCRVWLAYGLELPLALLTAMADGSPTATELNVVENVDKNAQKENDIGEEMNVLRGCYERWQVGHASGEIGPNDLNSAIDATKNSSPSVEHKIECRCVSRCDGTREG